MVSNGDYASGQFPRQTLLYLRTLQRRPSPSCIPQIPHRRWDDRHDEDLTKENSVSETGKLGRAQINPWNYVGPAKFPSARIVMSPSSRVPWVPNGETPILVHPI